MRAKGFEVSNKNSRNPTEIAPKIDSTRADKTSGKCRLNNATAALQPASIKAHNSSEPSWAPHTALNLK